MNFYTIPSALFIAFVFTIFFALFTDQNGAWRALFIFFFIIFLAGWAGQLWISPFGPLWLGVSWFTPFGVGLILTLLIIAMSPPPKVNNEKKVAKEEENGSVFILGMFFWLLIFALIISIAVGYYRMPPLLGEIK